MKLILDYSKWRCGGFGSNRIGEGDTKLMNVQGFQCCLGQFSLQLNPELRPWHIVEEAAPGHLNLPVPLLKYEDTSTDLSIKAIAINDSTDTTPEEKIEQLRYLFSQYGVEIEVINKP